VKRTFLGSSLAFMNEFLLSYLLSLYGRYQEGALASWSADEVAKRNTWLTKRRKRLEQKQQDELHAAKLASKLPGSRPGSPGGVGSDAEGIVEEEAKRAPTKKYDDSDTESSDEDEDEDDEDDEDEGKEKGRGTGTHDASNGAGIGAEGKVPVDVCNLPQ